MIVIYIKSYIQFYILLININEANLFLNNVVRLLSASPARIIGTEFREICLRYVGATFIIASICFVTLSAHKYPQLYEIFMVVFGYSALCFIKQLNNN